MSTSTTPPIPLFDTLERSGRMNSNGIPNEGSSRRRIIARLLVFASEMEKAGRISKASKGLLKELIVHENETVMSIGHSLAKADEGERRVALGTLEELIKQRASKSHQELFEICSLEQAHLLSQQDTEALVEGSDTKSLVYGEIDFWSFYDVVRVAVNGIDTDQRDQNNDRKTPSGSVGHTNGVCSRDRAEERPDAPERGGDTEKSYKEAHGKREDPSKRGAVEGRWKGGGAATGVGGGNERGLKFYDLGSGSGKAVFAAVLAVDFRCAVGIEVLASVHRASTRVLGRYRKLVEPVLCSPATINLYHGSFLAPEFDWTDGDVVFANSTCFAEDTLAAIASRAVSLRPGARIVTFTTALKTPWLRVLSKRRYRMSWGPATVFIHQKLSPQEYVTRLADTTPFDEDQGILRGGGSVAPAPELAGDNAASGNCRRDCVNDSAKGGTGNGYVTEEEEEEEEEEQDTCSLPRRPLRC